MIMFLVLPILTIWNCVPELTKDCIDMTILRVCVWAYSVGPAISDAISWWVYTVITRLL